MIIREATVSYKITGRVEGAKVLSSPALAYEYARGFVEANDYESLWVIPLNRKTVPCRGAFRISEGGHSQTDVPIPKILRYVLMAGGCGFIIFHNHPSGDPTPSQPDRDFTHALNHAAKTVQLAFMDHLVIGFPDSDPFGKGWRSLRQEGIVG